MNKLLYKLYPNRIFKFIIVLLICAIIYTPIIPYKDSISSNLLQTFIILALFVGFTIIMFFSYRSHGENLFEKQQFILKISLQMILIIIGFQIIINAPFTFFISKLIHPSQQVSASAVTDYSWLFFLNIIILGPMLEEWMFRGCFLRSLLTKYSDRKAIIISAIIFALIYLVPVQMFGALILGLYFGKILCENKKYNYGNNTMQLQISAE